jgi:hypothetical protein
MRTTQKMVIASALLLLLGGGVFMHAVEVANASANLIRLQFRDGTCSNGTGSAVGNPNISGSWSSWFGDSDTYDADCVRIEQGTPAIAAATDIRICAQAADGDWWGNRDSGTAGTVRCTPWASAGGGWSSYLSDNDLFDPDYWRIRIDSQAMSGQSITDMRVAVQVTEPGGGGGCGTQQQGPERWTPYKSAGGGWSNWAGDSDNQNFNCLRIYLGTVMAPDLTVNPIDYTTFVQGESNSLSYTINNIGAGATPGDVNSTILFDYQNNGFTNDANGDFLITTTGASLGASSSRSISNDVTFSSAGTWSVTVTTDYLGVITESNEGNNGMDPWDVFTVTEPSPPSSPPSITFEAENVTIGSGMSSADLTIGSEDEVEMQWSATDADTCTKSFVAGTATSGGPIGIDEPYAGAFEEPYTISCTGPGGTTGETILISVASSTPTLTVNDSDKLVRKGDTVEFSWDLNGNDPAGCSFSGPGAPASVAGADNPFTVAIQGASTYLLTCDGGTAQVRMQILPDIYET